MDDQNWPYIAWNILYVVLGMISFVFSLIIPLMYYFYPMTRQHPNIILVMICLTEVCEIYHQLINKHLGSEDDLEYFNQILEIYQLGFKDLETRNSNITKYFVSLQLNLYIVWCFDLVLTLRSPLANAQLRYLFYIPFTILMVISQSYDNDYLHWTQLTVQLQYTVCLLTILYCLFLILRAKNLKNKVISVLKIKYLTQQAISLVLVMAMNSISVIDRKKWALENPHLISCLILSQGITYGLMRLQEKYFRKQLFRSLCQFLGIKNNIEINIKQQQDQSGNIPLFILVRTIQSQQIMYGILEGIQQSTQQYEIMNDTYSQIRQHDVLIDNPVFVENSDDVDKVFHTQKYIESTINSTFTDPRECSKEILIKKNETVKMAFVEYAPSIFSYLRELDLINVVEIENSLSLINNKDSIKELSKSSGKSKAIFFLNYNKKFLIKTLTKGEFELLIQILPKYHEYITKNKKSQLARIYGCYRIQIEDTAPIHLILMENILKRINKPYQIYDLKGSLLGRKTMSKIYGKDLDFLDQQEFLFLQEKERKYLLEQIRQDCEFLQGLKIMDYSLLLGVNQYEQDAHLNQKNELSRPTRLFHNSLSHQQYSFGIIDYLQEYNTKKLIENYFKSILNQQKLISSVPPSLYSDRFINFMNSIICIYKKY